MGDFSTLCGLTQIEPLRAARALASPIDADRGGRLPVVVFLVGARLVSVSTVGAFFAGVCTSARAMLPRLRGNFPDCPSALPRVPTGS